MGRRVNLFMAATLGSLALLPSQSMAGSPWDIPDTYIVSGGSIDDLKNNTAAGPIVCEYEKQKIKFVRNPDKNDEFMVTEQGWNAKQVIEIATPAQAAKMCADIKNPRSRPLNAFTLTVGGRMSELKAGTIDSIRCESINQNVTLVRDQNGKVGINATYEVFEGGWGAGRVVETVSAGEAARICEDVKKPRKSWLNP